MQSGRFRVESKEMRMKDLLNCSVAVTIIFFFFYSLHSAGLPGEVFSQFSFSARAISLGGAYTAVAEGSSGIYFNPAAVIVGKKREIRADWASGFFGTAGNFSYINPLNGWAFDLNFIQSPEGTKTNSIGEVEGNFREKLINCGLSKSYKFGKDKYLGFRAKFLRQSILGYSASSIGLDVGFLWDVFSRRVIDEEKTFAPLTIGVKFENIIPPVMKLGEEKETYRANLRIGEALRFKNGKIVFSIDELLVDFKHFYWYSGIELNIIKGISFKVGKNFKETSLGISLNTDSFVFEYSKTMHEISNNEIFSVNINLGWTGSLLEKKLKEKEKQLQEIEKAFKKIKKAEDLGIEVTKEEKIDAKGKLKYVWDIYYKLDYNRALAEILKLSPYLQGDMEYEELYHLIKAQVFIKQGKFKQAKSVLYEGLVINPESKRLLDMIKRIDRLMGYIK